MIVARSLVGGLIALGLWSAACGDGQPAPSSAPAAPNKEAAPVSKREDPDGAERELGLASARIARLIPASTAIYVQLESFKRFDSLVGRLARAHEDMGRQIDELGRQVHRMLPGDERQILQDRPIGIAIVLPPDRDPQVTVVLPMKDVALYKRSLQLGPTQPQPVFDGSYMAVTSSTLYERPREAVELAADVRDNALTVRVDLPRLDHRYGSQMRLALVALAAGKPIEGLQGNLFEGTIPPSLQQFADPLLFALAVGRRAELTVEVDAERMHVRCEVETRDAGVLAGWTASPSIDLVPLARSMAASDSFALLAGCDPGVLSSRFAPLVTATDAQAERLAGMLERFADPFGSLVCVSGSLSAGDAHLSLRLNTADRPEAGRELASNFEMFSRSGLGVVVQSKATLTQEDVEVQDLQVRFDAVSMCALTGEIALNLPAVQARLDSFAGKLFGADTVRVRIASIGGRGLIAIGNDNAWFRRALLWTKLDKDLTPPDVKYAVEHLGEVRAAAVLRVDISRWLHGFSQWRNQARMLYEPVRQRGLPVEVLQQALDPQPLTLAVGAEGRTFRMGLSMKLPGELSADMARR